MRGEGQVQYVQERKVGEKESKARSEKVALLAKECRPMEAHKAEDTHSLPHIYTHSKNFV